MLITNRLRSWMILFRIQWFALCEPTPSQCNQVEQGNNKATLEFSFQNLNTKETLHLNIYSGDTLIAHCKTATECSDYYTKTYKTIIDTNKVTQKITIVVNIYNVSKSGKGEDTIVWQILNNNTVLKKCIFVYARVKSIYCTQSIFDDGLNITCRSSDAVSKNAFCDMSVAVENYINCSETRESHFSRKTFSDRINTDSVCIFTIPKSNLSEGRFTFSVKVYPHVFGNDYDKTFGTSQVIPLHLEYPDLTLRDCPLFVKENEEVTCICEYNKTSIINFTVSWYFMNESKRVLISESNILTLNRKMKNIYTVMDFFCITNNPLDWSNNGIPTNYSPIILDLHHNSTEEDLISVSINRCVFSTTIAAVVAFFLIWTFYFNGFFKSHFCYKNIHLKKHKDEEIDNSVIYNLDSRSNDGDYLSICYETQLQKTVCPSEASLNLINFESIPLTPDVLITLKNMPESKDNDLITRVDVNGYIYSIVNKHVKV